MNRNLAVIGEKSGFLTLVSLHEKRRGGYRWVAKCDCGNKTIVTVRDFRSGHTRSCGCFRKKCSGQKNLRHGKSETAEFRSWCHMISRCYSRSDHKYHYYGARGIVVCAQWLKDFEQFYADMGPRPSANHSIDRIDNDKGYFPENCRWATNFEQARNKRNNVHVVVDGQKVVVAQAERILGIGYGSINQRSRKRRETYQMSVEHFMQKYGS